MTGRVKKIAARRLGEASEKVAVQDVLTNFTVDVDQQLSKLVRAYFTGRRRKLDLLLGAKVVARLEVRQSGHYLDVSLGEVGENGKVRWHMAWHHSVRTRRRG